MTTFKFYLLPADQCAKAPVRDDPARSSEADPVVPPYAVEISRAEAERLVGEPIAEMMT